MIFLNKTSFFPQYCHCLTGDTGLLDIAKQQGQFLFTINNVNYYVIQIGDQRKCIGY